MPTSRLILAAMLVASAPLAAARIQSPVRINAAPGGVAGVEIDDSALPAMASGTATVTGRVLDAGTRQPLAGASVTIGTSGRRGVHVITDAQGAFAATALAGGVYSVSVVCDGYLPGAFGRTRPSGASQALSLNDGERRAGVEVELFQFGRIEGAVADESRAPLASANLQAISRAVVAGTPQWVPGRRAATSADGTYHLDSLTPGTWIIAATSPQRGTTFYPSSPSASGAVPIDLPSGATRSAIDFALPPAATFDISGVATRADGPAAGVRLILESLDPMASALAPRSIRSAPNGAYTFSGVAPGDYRVRAYDPEVVAGRAPSVMPVSGEQFNWADAMVSINDRGATGVDLLLQPAPHVSGAVRFSGAASKPSEELVAKAAVFLDPADGRPSLIANIGAITADGRFRTSAVVPGRYVLRMAGTLEWRGWSLASAQLDGKDISDEPFEVTRDASDVVITFTDHSSQVSGNVTTSTGAADTHAVVIIFPQDRDRWVGAGQNPRRMRRLSTDVNGYYSAINLPPGSYCIAAVNEAAGADWNDPALLEALLPSAARVSVRAGGSATQSLRTVFVKK